MGDILIICAMPKEAKFIANKLKLEQIQENVYKNENITLLISGIGKQRTAICLTKYLCENAKPDKVINIGYAGATDIPVGKWVNITRAYNYEWEIPGEEKYVMLDYGSQKLETIENDDVEKVECYTAECFVVETDIEEHIAFDMELHSIAFICDEYNIPLYSLKKISDNLSFEKYHENVKMEEIFELHSSIDILKNKKII